MMKRLAMLAPTVLVIGLLFIGGFVLGLLQSLNYFPSIGLYDFNLDAYKNLFSDRVVLQSALLTFGTAIVTTFLTILFAFFSALALRRTFTGKRTINFLYQFPITIPHLVIAVGVMMLLSQSGFIARIGYGLGLLDSPEHFPVFVHDSFGIGVMVVYLWKQIPFVGLIILSIMQSSANNYEELARSLGANRWQAFRHALLPIVIPGIFPASIICFSYVLGSYEVPFLLGKPYPAFLSVIAYKMYESSDLNMRPESMAIMVTITGIVCVLAVAYRSLLHKMVGNRR